MTCASCGSHNPAGARYCTRCGAELSDPTPIAAVAAAANGAMARAARAQAANAAHADAAAASLQAANQASADPAWRQQPHEVDVRDPPALPAYGQVPPRRGIALALLVACVIAAAVVIAWRLTGSERSDAVAERAVPEGDANAPTAPPPLTAAPATPAESPSLTSPPAAPSAAAQSAPPVPAADDARAANAEASQPVEITPLPARPAPPRTTRRAAPEKSAPPAAASAPAASPPPPAPVARAPVAAPSALPIHDRWARMNEELSRCTREDFIARVICGQRVRFRYCEGYWGKVEACPASPAPERGQ
jgi:hypothetical protein